MDVVEDGGDLFFQRGGDAARHLAVLGSDGCLVAMVTGENRVPVTGPLDDQVAEDADFRDTPAEVVEVGVSERGKQVFVLRVHDQLVDWDHDRGLHTVLAV